MSPAPQPLQRARTATLSAIESAYDSVGGDAGVAEGVGVAVPGVGDGSSSLGGRSPPDVAVGTGVPAGVGVSSSDGGGEVGVGVAERVGVSDGVPSGGDGGPSGVAVGEGDSSPCVRSPATASSGVGVGSGAALPRIGVEVGACCPPEPSSAAFAFVLRALHFALRVTLRVNNLEA